MDDTRQELLNVTNPANAGSIAEVAVGDPGSRLAPEAVTPPDAATSSNRRWVFKLVLEVLSISLGVFLALMGDQWRERRHDQELARDALQRFRTEIQINRKAVAAVKDYHVTIQTALRRFLDADPKTRTLEGLRIQGLQPVFFERTAWDLAIATQSLPHIDSELAFSLSRVYGLQQTYAEMTRGIMQAIYLRPMLENIDGLAAYYGDVVLWEPGLIAMYDELLPRIDKALTQ